MDKINIYEIFNERTKGVEFSDYEKQKILFQIVKNIEGVQILNDSEETESYCTHRGFGLLQTTYRKYDDTFHTVINLGMGNYNLYSSEEFNELFPKFYTSCLFFQLSLCKRGWDKTPSN